MNVLLMTSIPLTPPWDQGDKNLAFGLAQTMRAARFLILTRKGGEQPQERHLTPIPVFSRGNTGLLNKALVIFNLYANRQKIQNRGKVDLIHLLYRPYRLSAWALKALSRAYDAPVIQTIPATRDGRYLGRDLFITDKVVTLSEYGRKKILDLGIPNVITIPPGICIDHWQRVGGETNGYKKMLSMEGRPVVFFPGHFGEGMGADVMLQALPRIAAQIPDVLIVFACRIRSQADLIKERDAQRRLSADKLADNVRFYNTIGDIHPFIGASDLAALPLETMREKIDLPTTLIEFMAAGKAIVLSDLAPMNEILATPEGLDRWAGALVHPGDSQELSECIIGLLKDASARAKMGQRGQEHANTRFDIRITAEQYLNLYTETISERQECTSSA